MSKWSPLLSFHSGYATKGQTAVLTPATGSQLKLHSVKLHNRSGGAIDAGLMIKLADGSWEAGKVIAADTPDYTEQTTQIQAGTATNIFTLTNNDGFLVQADRPFDMIGMVVSQAQTGAPVYTYEYFDGTAYQTLTTVSVPTSYSAGAQYIVFPSPAGWSPGTTAAVGGDSALYSILVRATTAPTQIVKITSLWVAKFLCFQEALADNATISLDFDEQLPFVAESGEGLLPYFGTASANNIVSGFYQVSD